MSGQEEGRKRCSVVKRCVCKNCTNIGPAVKPPSTQSTFERQPSAGCVVQRRPFEVPEKRFQLLTAHYANTQPMLLTVTLDHLATISPFPIHPRRMVEALPVFDEKLTAVEGTVGNDLRGLTPNPPLAVHLFPLPPQIAPLDEIDRHNHAIVRAYNHGVIVHKSYQGFEPIFPPDEGIRVHDDDEIASGVCDTQVESVDVIGLL